MFLILFFILSLTNMLFYRQNDDDEPEMLMATQEPLLWVTNCDDDPNDPTTMEQQS
jgi:hypothetical protein